MERRDCVSCKYQKSQEDGNTRCVCPLFVKTVYVKDRHLECGAWELKISEEDSNEQQQ